MLRRRIDLPVLGVRRFADHPYQPDPRALGYHRPESAPSYEVVTVFRVVSSSRKLMPAKPCSLLKYFRLNDNPGRGCGQSKSTAARAGISAQATIQSGEN